jgi:hypothetical protein
MAVDVSEGGGKIGEAAAACGTDAGGAHNLFGECLGRLQLGRCGAGTQDGSPFGPKPVGQATCQRRLRSHNSEIDPVHVRGIGNAVEIVGCDGEILRQLGRSGIARRAVQSRLGILAPECPTERVLAPATSDHE